jgi:hypothetical protein
LQKEELAALPFTFVWILNVLNVNKWYSHFVGSQVGQNAVVHLDHLILKAFLMLRGTLAQDV